MRIMAFDPGYGRMGWACIIQKPEQGQLQYLSCGVLETKAGQAMTLRMAKLLKEIRNIMAKYQPDCFAMERLYFSRNQKTAAGVYQAQGLILAAAGERGASLEELEPKLIKKAVSASGKASKAQLMKICCRILSLEKDIRPDDAADALACAIAAYFRFQSLTKKLT